MNYLCIKYHLRMLPICFGLSLSIGSASCEALALSEFHHSGAIAYSSNVQRSHLPTHPSSQKWVKNCDDQGTDSFRDAIGSAASGDTINFDTSAMTCSRISLTTGQVDVPQDDILILGPTDTRIVISAEGSSRVLNHTGMGTLAIYDLSLSDGHYSASGFAYGGCLRSAGSIWSSKGPPPGRRRIALFAVPLSPFRRCRRQQRSR